MFATKLFLGLLVFVLLSGQKELDDDKKIENEFDALAKELDNLKDDKSSVKGFLNELKFLRKIFHKHSGDDVKRGTIKKLKEKTSQIFRDGTIKAKLIELVKKRGDSKKLTDNDWKELKDIVDDYYKRNPQVRTEVEALLASKKIDGKLTKVMKSILKLPPKMAKWVFNIIVAFAGEAGGFAMWPIAIACFFSFGLLNLLTLFSSRTSGELAIEPTIVAFGLTLFSLTPSDKNFMREFMI